MSFAGRLLESLAAIRFFEERVAELYPRGVFRCPVHLAVGHEGSAVGVCAALEERDRVVGYHRSHHHYLARGGDPARLLAELAGDGRGCSGGHGGSTHLYAPEAGFWGSTAIISGMVPVATGLAHAAKLGGGGGLVACFVGDAAPEEGVFFESLNLAALWKLPVLFVIEDNDLSCYTSKSLRQAWAGIGRIAGVFDLPSEDADGADVLAVHAAAQRLARGVRDLSRPALLRVGVHRAHEHCGPDREGSSLEARGDGCWPGSDPLRRLIPQVPDAEKILAEARAKIDRIFAGVAP